MSSSGNFGTMAAPVNPRDYFSLQDYNILAIIVYLRKKFGYRRLSRSQLHLLL